MQNRNNNFKNGISGSIHNSPNEFRARSRIAFRRNALRASARKIKRALSSLDSYAVRIPFGAVISTRARRDTNSYSRIAGWSLAALAVFGVFGVFGYLTFMPEQAFATYDWETRKLSDITTMQQMNAKICENTTEIGTQYQLEDTRDGKKYYVAKLQDGNCWMTQNLAYGAVSDTGIGTPCKLSGTSNGATCTNGTSWTNSPTDKYFAIGSHTDGSHSSMGNYYNWPAAVQNGSGGDEIQGVCPDNWQLPTGGPSNADGKSFGGLTSVYGISSNVAGNKALRDTPLFFQYNGCIDSGTLKFVSSRGYYWSSTLKDDNFAYELYFASSDYVNPFNDNDRLIGRSVRCVAADVYPEKPPITDNDTANVAITVSPVISIDVTKHANDMTVDFTKVATSTIIARVGSNQPYKVMLSTDKSDLTNPKTNQVIPMIPSDQTIVKGINSWGIKKLSSPTDTEVNESTIYSPVGINGNKELFYISTSAASEDLTFPVAIAVDSSLSSGQYSTQVTLTVMSI